MKKTIVILTMTALMFSCQKESSIIKIIPKQTVSVTNNAVINGGTVIDLNIKTYVTKGNVETITLKNGVVIVRTKDAVNLELWHIVKTTTGGKKYLYNELVHVVGGSTNITLNNLDGTVAATVSIDASGHFNNLYQDRLIQQSCVGNAFHQCISSGFCTALCTFGGWGGCFLGWAICCDV